MYIDIYIYRNISKHWISLRTTANGHIIITVAWHSWLDADLALWAWFYSKIQASSVNEWLFISHLQKGNLHHSLFPSSFARSCPLSVVCDYSLFFCKGPHSCQHSAFLLQAPKIHYASKIFLFVVLPTQYTFYKFLCSYVDISQYMYTVYFKHNHSKLVI